MYRNEFTILTQKQRLHHQVYCQCYDQRLHRNFVKRQLSRHRRQLVRRLKQRLHAFWSLLLILLNQFFPLFVHRLFEFVRIVPFEMRFKPYLREDNSIVPHKKCLFVPIVRTTLS